MTNSSHPPIELIKTIADFLVGWNFCGSDSREDAAREILDIISQRRTPEPVILECLDRIQTVLEHYQGVDDGGIGFLKGFAAKADDIDPNSMARGALADLAIVRQNLGASEIRLLNPGMPAQELRLHLGEMTAQEERTARAAIRWANAHARDTETLSPLQCDLASSRLAGEAPNGDGGGCSESTANQAISPAPLYAGAQISAERRSCETVGDAPAEPVEIRPPAPDQQPDELTKAYQEGEKRGVSRAEVDRILASEREAAQPVGSFPPYEAMYAWHRIMDTMEFYATTALYSHTVSKDGQPKEVGYLASNCVPDVKKVDAFLNSLPERELSADDRRFAAIVLITLLFDKHNFMIAESQMREAIDTLLTHFVIWRRGSEHD